MEEDREETNLGPELPANPDQTPHIQSKTPRKRFVGRRVATEKTAARTSESGTTNRDRTLQAFKPTRAPRTLNQIPASILHDEALNAAIAHLPPNYNFEIHKTIHRIRESGAQNVALQFPEGLLMFAPMISDIVLQFCPGTDTLIMGDVTYGACCIDDYTARALGCDLLVHYGHSCLVPVDTTKGIKTLYVFVTIGIDTEHLINTIERNFQPGKKIALVGTIQFNATLHSITPRLRSSGYETTLPRSAPLSAGEILGCTAPSVALKGSQASGDALEADTILYVGDGRFHLESILIASPSLREHTYRYDPYTRRLTRETYDHKEMHSLRRRAIQMARKTLAHPKSTPLPSSGTSAHEPKPWGLILGTLGRQGNPHTLSLITTHLTNRGVPYITLLLSEIHPVKLGSMSKDVVVWVQIACPRLSIDWGYAFERPLLSPYEACVALDVKEGISWIGNPEDPSGMLEANACNAKGTNRNAVETSIGQEIGVYPMDFYEKGGLGRTTGKDVPPVEVQVA